jgi:hypothetical protein
LHSSKINRDTCRQIIKAKVSLPIKLEEHEDIEPETNNLLNLLQHAAKEAPQINLQRATNNIHLEIKKLVAERKEPGQSSKELTHQTAEGNVTEKATNLNQIFKKCGIKLLKNTSVIQKAKSLNIFTSPFRSFLSTK